MKKTWLALIAVVVMAGCVPRGVWIDKVNYTRITHSPGGYLKNYELGRQQSAFVGKEIINVTRCDSFQPSASTDQIISLKGNDRYVRPQTYSTVGSIPISGTVIIDKNTYYVVRPDNSEWGIVISDTGEIYGSALYGFNYNLLYFPPDISISPKRYEYSALCARYTPSAISFSLIYTGKNDISLNAIYREYSYKDMARPAFFQNITYQADAKQIRYRDFVIKIDDVSNEKITYTVLEDGLK